MLSRVSLQVVRNAGPVGGVPGTACNPTKAAGGQ